MDQIEMLFEKAHGNIQQESMHAAIDNADHTDFVYTQTRQHQIDPVVLRQRRVVTLQRHSFESDVFRLLRTKILKQLRENSWNSIGITAPTKGAGKTMVAVNLAVAMAMEVNQTVLLVDIDLRFPKVHWYFDLEVKEGLRDHLISDKPLSDILVNPGIKRLVILPGKGQAIDSSEILSGPKMRNLVDEIKKRYQSRIIIFDLPPVLASDDVLASMGYFDAALLVVEEGANKPEEVTKSLRMLSEVPLLGTVLNKSQNPPEYQHYYR